MIFSSSTLFSQELIEDHYGVQVGISADLGTHINRIGVRFQGYGAYKFAQLNVGHSIYFNGKNLANRQSYFSNRTALGVVLLGGKRNTIPQFIFDGLNHQTKYEYGLAYNYIWYFDNAGSSQRSGGFGLHVREFSLLIENDLFAGSGRDRFRTSDFSLHYHNEIINLSVKSQLWTGDTRGVKLRNTADSIYIKGYKDLSETKFGRFSHGIIGVGVDYLVGYGNRLNLSAGVDHERIRDVLQNKIMHDKPFIPKRWRTPNVNYPMLDMKGSPVHETGKERPGRFFFQMGTNRSLTY